MPSPRIAAADANGPESEVCPLPTVGRLWERGIAFDDPAGLEEPTYRDFAYVASTIGMCYQVPDT